MRISSGKYRSGKGNLFAACPVHFLTSRIIGNVYICPVRDMLQWFDLLLAVFWWMQFYSCIFMPVFYTKILFLIVDCPIRILECSFITLK